MWLVFSTVAEYSCEALRDVSTCELLRHPTSDWKTPPTEPSLLCGTVQLCIMLGQDTLLLVPFCTALKQAPNLGPACQVFSPGCMFGLEHVASQNQRPCVVHMWRCNCWLRKRLATYNSSNMFRATLANFYLCNILHDGQWYQVPA